MEDKGSSDPENTPFDVIYVASTPMIGLYIKFELLSFTHSRCRKDDNPAKTTSRGALWWLVRIGQGQGYQRHLRLIESL